jgi:hypothetical protein
MHIHIYICIYIYLFMCIYIYVCKYIHIYTYIYVNIYIVLSVKPRDMNSEELIPYMALEADGNWETIEQGRAEISGYELFIHEQFLYLLFYV